MYIFIHVYMYIYICIYIYVYVDIMDNIFMQWYLSHINCLTTGLCSCVGRRRVHYPPGTAESGRN